MDNKQKLSIVRHISQKIFVNKCSALDTKLIHPNVCQKYYENFAADSLTAAAIFVATYETVMKESGAEDESDVCS